MPVTISDEDFERICGRVDDLVKSNKETLKKLREPFPDVPEKKWYERYNTRYDLTNLMFWCFTFGFLFGYGLCYSRIG
jgi:hypothetical protein